MGSTTIRFGAGDTRNSGISSFVSQTSVFNPMGTEANATPSSRIPDIGVFEQYHGFQFEEPANFGRSPVFNSTFTSQTVSPDLQGGAFPSSLATKSTNFSVALPEYQPLQLQNGLQRRLASSSGAQHENWGESNMADSGSHSDTSTDVDLEDKNQRSASVGGSDSSDETKEKKSDQKTLRRLAQNREAARKSRMRKKVYVQQLENSRLKLTQLEQELQRARQQGVFISNSSTGDQSQTGRGAMAFDVEYARWTEEQNKQINELRTAVNSHASDTELRPTVDNVTAHFNDIFRVKANAAKTDVFHILSGMWKTPSERCFMWIGGFRPSELLKLLANQLEPLTEQQLTGIYNLQQTSTQAEDALSQGMDALQQSLAETLANGEGSSGNVANYMGQMAMAMGKLGTLEGFLHQADNLRQQTLQQMHRVLITRQSARALLLIHDYFARLRALSSLWLARPRE